MTSQERV